MQSISIRHRLLFLSLSFIVLLWLLAAALIFVQSRHEVEEIFDAHLIQDARVLANFSWQARESGATLTIHASEAELNSDDAHHHHHYEKRITFLVRTRTGDPIARTAQAPIFPVYPNFSLREYHDQQGYWRVFTLMENGLIVQTAERYGVRNKITHKVVVRTLLAALLTLPLLALLIGWSVGYSFRPLRQLSTKLCQRHADQLQPLDIHHTPLEIQPVVNALNQLFQRVEQTLNNERRFTADAAHELRTPLAGLKTQVQVALRSDNEQQRQMALQHMLHGIDRASRLVEQLLTLARIDAQASLPKQDIDLESVLHDVINNALPEALLKNIDLGLHNKVGRCIVSAHPESLNILLRNFIDNALRYTPADGQVTVYLQTNDKKHLCLCIDDNGIGIPPEQRDVVFERFYRGQHQHLNGSGLGLSIAKRIVDLHGWELTLATGLSGQGLAVWINTLSSH